MCARVCMWVSEDKLGSPISSTMWGLGCQFWQQAFFPAELLYWAQVPNFISAAVDMLRV